MSTVGRARRAGGAAPKLRRGQQGSGEATFSARDGLPVRLRAGGPGPLFGPSPLPAAGGVGRGAGRGVHPREQRPGFLPADLGLNAVLTVPDPVSCCPGLSLLCTQDPNHGVRYGGTRTSVPLQEMHPRFRRPNFPTMMEARVGPPYEKCTQGPCWDPYCGGSRSQSPGVFPRFAPKIQDPRSFTTMKRPVPFRDLGPQNILSMMEP